MEEDWGVCAVDAMNRLPMKTAPEKHPDLVMASVSAHAAVSTPAALHALEYASEREIHLRL